MHAKRGSCSCLTTRCTAFRALQQCYGKTLQGKNCPLRAHARDNERDSKSNKTFRSQRHTSYSAPSTIYTPHSSTTSDSSWRRIADLPAIPGALVAPVAAHPPALLQRLRPKEPKYPESKKLPEHTCGTCGPGPIPVVLIAVSVAVCCTAAGREVRFAVQTRRR